MRIMRLFKPSRSEMPPDVQNERLIAGIRVTIATMGIMVTLVWLAEPFVEFRLFLQSSILLFIIWAAINVSVVFLLRNSRAVGVTALCTTLLDILTMASLEVIILQQSHLDFITGPHVALYFSVIAAASLRHNARLVRLTGMLCATVHLITVAGCYIAHDIPIAFSMINDDGLPMKWLSANDVIISIIMAGFGYLLGQATSELIESEAHYLALFNSLPDGILITSARMRILASNKKFQRMVGMEETELIGRPLQQFFAGKSPTMTMRIDAEQLIDTPFARLYGSKGSLPVQITQSTIDWNGQQCMELSVRDMSERYELELTLARAQKVQTVGKLAGGLAHDFNNLLSGIFGSVSLAKRVIQRLPNVDEAKIFSRYIDTISDCGQTATQILERLSRFSRSSIVQTTDIDILEILNDTVTIVSNTLPANVQIEIKNTTTLMAKADKTSLSQAMMNLCINARDAIGAAPGRIELSATLIPKNALPENLNLDPEKEYICIQVKDTGPGMDASTMQKIFDPFFTTKSKDQGTGIGLSMVYNIAFVHGGAVDVISRPGRETIFFLYIEASRDSLLPLD